MKQYKFSEKFDHRQGISTVRYFSNIPLYVAPEYEKYGIGNFRNLFFIRNSIRFTNDFGRRLYFLIIAMLNTNCIASAGGMLPGFPAMILQNP